MVTSRHRVSKLFSATGTGQSFKVRRLSVLKNQDSERRFCFFKEGNLETISLLEGAELKLEGTRRRLARAQAAIEEFHADHGNPRLQMRASSFEHQQSLLTEYHALLVEHDDAARSFQKTLADWAAVKGK